MFASRTDWPLVPNRLSKQLEDRRRRALPVLDLTESNPTRCGFDYDVQEVLGALTDARSLTYDPDPRGPLASRLAVVDYYAERGAELTPEQLFLTTSTSEAYSFVFRLLADPGDNVLVPRPSYPLLDFLARLDSVELNSYSLVYDQGWQIDLGSVERALTPRTRAIVVIHPNNPTGSYVRPEERQALLECCSKRQLALVADEVFFDYALGPEAEGGWKAILRLPSTRIDEDWAMDLRRADGVLVHPGHFYDFASEGFLVVSLLTKPETFEEGTAKVLARVSRSV